MKMSQLPIRGKHTGLDSAISPFHVNFGSKERVRMSAKYLKDAKFVEGGRVSILLGNYEYRAKGGKALLVPVCAYETQMGMAAVDIIAREVIHYSSIEPKFRYNGAEVSTGGAIIEIRAGTCGGCNTENLDSPAIKIGDMVVGQKVIGTSGTIMQALGYMPVASMLGDQNVALELFNACQKWGKLGGRITKEGYLEMDNSGMVALALGQEAKRNKTKVYSGTAFSKESLYSEANHGIFVKLRNDHNVLASEMEGLQLAYLASEAASHGINVHAGLIACVVGVVPGTGFPNNREEEQIAKQSEASVIKIALDAIGNIAEKLGNAPKDRF